MAREESADGGSGASGSDAVCCERRFSAVEKEDVGFVVESAVGKRNSVRFVELASVNGVVARGGCEGQVGPGQPVPSEIDEGKQETPQKNVATRTK
jgi:hypothetical protein